MAPARRRNVVWSAAAAADLEAILDYIAADDPSTAARIFMRIRKAASKLKVMPDRGRVVPELREHGITAYREVISPPWRIIYRAGKRVHVLAVIDGRRNLEDVLLDRFARPDR